MYAGHGLVFRQSGLGIFRIVKEIIQSGFPLQCLCWKEKLNEYYTTNQNKQFSHSKGIEFDEDGTKIQI
jgi:hypothetical protein